MSNIIDFPETKDRRLNRVIELLAEKNTHIALNETLALIDEGCDEAYLYAGAIYEYGGHLVEKDADKAYFYYMRSIETRGAVEAYLGLARMLYRGEGIKQDFEQALQYYKKVAQEAEHPIAFLMLGEMYEHGYVVPVNLEEAKSYYKAAMEKGNVFGLTHLALLIQKHESFIKGIFLRLVAGAKAFFLSLKDEDDTRLRYHHPNRQIEKGS